LDVFIATELVQPCYDEIVLKKPVSCSRCFKFVIRHDFERKLKAPVQLILPLFGQATRADDQATVQVAPSDKFLDQKASHDGLAGTGVVRQQEAQWLTRQHFLIDRSNLMRQGINE
jgi:hypothetical protein